MSELSPRLGFSETGCMMSCGSGCLGVGNTCLCLLEQLLVEQERKCGLKGDEKWEDVAKSQEMENGCKDLSKPAHAAVSI